MLKYFPSQSEGKGRKSDSYITELLSIYPISTSCQSKPRLAIFRSLQHPLIRSLGSLEGGQLVAGPWGDLSPDLHKLLLIFAESRVAAMSRAQGWEAGPGQLGKVMGEIRRAMSVTVVRANALCLMERLCQLGPGARAAAQRRQAALHLEERRRQERQAFDLAWQARRSSRVGRAFIEQ